MAQFAWPTCPADVRWQVERLIAGFKQALHDNLVGIYLHSSLAMGCFNPKRSDVDLLVVTHERMSLRAKRELVVRAPTDPTPSTSRGVRPSPRTPELVRAPTGPTPSTSRGVRPSPRTPELVRVFSQQ